MEEPALDSAPAVRQAIPNDYSQIKGIIDLSFPRFYRYFAIHSVTSEEGKVLVAEIQGAIVGFAKLIEFNIGTLKCGCILWIAVHPSIRRRGVALSLTKAGVESLKGEGSHAVFASTQRRNMLLWQLWVKQVLCGRVFWVCGGGLVGAFLVFTVTFGLRLAKLF
jgi:N-acetylglutamate synthase-like GNAT family acetyltransferase